MINCLVVDDEPIARQGILEYIEQVEFLNAAAECKNAIEASSALENQKIDLVFLDIQMPGLSGLQFLQSLNEPPLIVLVTAYEKYALEGFNLNVVDYVLKPFSFERFLKAANRANELFKLKQLKASPTADAPDFFVNVEYTLVKIVVGDIEYIEGLKDYIKIHLSSSPKPVLTHMTIKAIEEKLTSPKGPGVFIRTHKSFLVASSKITSIKRDFVCINEKEIPVSEFYKENLKGLL